MLIKSLRALLAIVVLAGLLTLPAPTPAPAQSGGDFVKVQGNQLIFRGQPIKLKGINFYPKDQPWADMWSQWDGPAVKQDLARAKELGINTVRVLVPYKPQHGWTGKDTGEIQPLFLNMLQQFVQMVGEMEAKVIITLFDFYDPRHDQDLPAAERERRNRLYVEGIVSAFANDDRVLAWDLHNEPDHYETWRDDKDPASIVAWLDKMAAEVRRLDSNHPLTVGVGIYDQLFVADDTGAPYPDEPARGRTLADISDFISFHSYNAGNIDWQIEYIKLHANKPILLGETGWPSGPPCQQPDYSDARQVALYDLMIKGARKADLAGLLQWQLWDLAPGDSLGAGRESHEDYFGLLKRDGTWKPAMPLFRDGWPGEGATAPASPLPSQTTSNWPLTVMPRRPEPDYPGYQPPLYFPETGHYLHNEFRDYWRRFGGLEIFGYPITEQRKEGEYWVQYFERARFESHPEVIKDYPNWKQLDKATQYKLLVKLSLLGVDLAKKKTGGNGFPRVEAAQAAPDATFFPETGHTISGPISQYWLSRNGITNFGYPLSEPLREKSQADGKEYTVQYFERTRLEHHPENAGSQYEILLGLLGREALAARGCK
jgi:hypothetical protein